MELTNYALITGASEGFGKSLAFECAGREMNLILVALPGPEIHSLANFIRVNFNVLVVCFETDLSIESNCFKLYNEVKSQQLSVRYLLNNAGMLSRDMFCDLEADYFLTQIRLNVSAPTLLIKLLPCHQLYRFSRVFECIQAKFRRVELNFIISRFLKKS